MANQYQYSLSGTAEPYSFGSPAPTPTLAPVDPSLRADGTYLKRPLTHPCTWDGCDRMFSCPHNVEQHIREAHTGERPYPCSLCNKRFTRPWSLYRHREGVHGILGGPGRGRGSGLKKIGLEKPQASGARKTRRHEGMNTGRLKDFDIADLNVEFVFVQRQQQRQQQQQQQQQHQQRQHQQQRQQLLPQLTSSKPTEFEVNNFTAMPTACVCGLQFENREAFLAHRHNDHGDANSPQCNCMMCLGLFNGEVDNAGVSVREKSAATLRDLTADDLFSGGDAYQATVRPGQVQYNYPASNCPAPAAFSASISQNVAEDGTGSEAWLPAGMTEEQFTANMSMDPSTPTTEGPLFAGTSAESPTTTNMFSDADGSIDQGTAEQLDTRISSKALFGEGAMEDDFDNLGLWPKSADDLFGADDELASYPGVYGAGDAGDASHEVKSKDG